MPRTKPNSAPKHLPEITQCTLAGRTQNKNGNPLRDCRSEW